MRVGLRLAMGAAIVVVAGASLQTAERQTPASVTIAGAQLKKVAYLKGSNTKPGDHFGCGGVLDGHAGFGAAVSGDGNTLAIGAPHDSGGAKGVNGKGGGEVYASGAVYVFVRNGANWAQQAYIKPSNPQMSAELGHAVVLI